MPKGAGRERRVRNKYVLKNAMTQRNAGNNAVDGTQRIIRREVHLQAQQANTIKDGLLKANATEVLMNAKYATQGDKRKARSARSK